VAKKAKQEEVSAGAPAWMATYGDMMTLLLCFFVLLFSMSSVDVAKFKAAMSSFADQIDILPGGVALTEGDLLSNGVSQLNDIQVVFAGGMALNSEADETLNPSGEEDKEKEEDSTSIKEEVDPYEEAKKIAYDIAEIISAEGLDTRVAISYTANYIKFTLKGEFLFDSGRANLKPQAAEAIGAIAEIAAKGEYEKYDIQIDGHTDNQPISSVQFPNNWILSSYRAYAVLENLIEVQGYSPERIAATGYGEYRPIADNDTTEGRSDNRRVEIKVLLDSEELSADDPNNIETSVEGTGN